MTRFGVPTWAHPQGTRPTDARLYRLLFIVAVVSGLLALFVATEMILQLRPMTPDDLLNAPDLLEKRQQLHQRPSDQELKDTIRTLDMQFRSQFFARRSLVNRGTWLLLPSVLLLIVSLKLMRRFHESPPTPPDASVPPPVTRNAPAARGSVAALGIVVVVSGLGLIALTSPPKGQMVDAMPAPAALPPINGDWPSFRGADGSGISPFTNLPTQWDQAKGLNILWKTPIPLPGHNSAIATAGKVFCTGADRQRRALFCFDARTGRLLWRHDVNDLTARDAASPQVMADTGFAAPTAATDGQRVYAIFANGDLVACDLDGKRLWAKALGVSDNSYGYACSLVAFEGGVIVQYDQGDADDDLSAVICFDGQTGSQRWRTARKTRASWSSPILISTSTGPQLITLADPWISALDPKDGREIWRYQGVHDDVAASPIFAGGLVIAVNPYDQTFAIRPDGSSDVSQTHLAWSIFDGAPDIPSPVSDGTFLYLLTTTGTLTCCRLSDGQVVWSRELDGSYQASPSIVGDKIYLVSASGRGIVLMCGDQYQEVAKNNCGEAVYASPAFLDGRLILRGQKNLIAIGMPNP